jgi:peptidoglycan/xylan/chitin deacetylase (PgdA/CDA1 family)
MIKLSFDDYSKNNYWLQELLLRFGLEKITTFFIQTGNDATKEQIRILNERGFEIGSHTVNHPQDLKTLSYPDLNHQLQTSKKIIEDLTGKECDQFAYPRGRHNDIVVKQVKEAGYKFARTTRVLETEILDPFRMGTTIHIYPRVEYKGRPWFSVAQFYLDHVKKNGGEFHLWGHADEIIKLNEVENFKKFLKLCQ